MALLFFLLTVLFVSILVPPTEATWFCASAPAPPCGVEPDDRERHNNEHYCVYDNIRHKINSTVNFYGPLSGILNIET